MFRILQKLLLTTLFALFTSQASAMFIQANWLDPTQPGAGTNRYAYSNNDPINLRDLNGNNFELGGLEYGVDTGGDGKPDAFDRGYGVGGATQAQKGNPVIGESFASGSQFAGLSKTVTSPQQAQSLANLGETQAESYQDFEDDLNTLGQISIGIVTAPVAEVAAGRVWRLGFSDDWALPPPQSRQPRLMMLHE